MEKLKLNIIVLRKFGITMGVAFLVISVLFLFRQKHTATLFSLLASCVFFLTGLAMPVLLKPVYIIWMRLAFILGWINTRVILFILFILVFTPLGLLMKLFRMDLLERKKKEGSYWKLKEKIIFNPVNYERRF